MPVKKKKDNRTKKIEKKPIRYRRPIPEGMHKVHHQILTEVKTGTLLGFVYGKKQKIGQTGGWKNDRSPIILVFYDDGNDYIEGINTNYLSKWYIKRLNQLLRIFPGVNGIELYRIFKRTAPFAISKGYRKYIRSSLNNKYTYEYSKGTVQKVNKEVE